MHVRPVSGRQTILGAILAGAFAGGGAAFGSDVATVGSTGCSESGNMAQRMISKEVTVRASVEDVWRAWTTTDGATGFFAPRAHIELRVGGPYELYFMPDAPEGSRGSEGCKILSFLPQEMLSFSWNAPPRFPNVRREHTCVVLRFEDLGDGRVKVRMAHHGWGRGEEWDQVYEYFEEVWPRVLDSFAARFPTESAGEKPAPARSPTQFAYFIRPTRPTFVEDATEQEHQTVQRHFEYLVDLREKGRLILAGRTQDNQPVGIVVFEARSLEEAEQIATNDPAVKAGIFSAEVRPFAVALTRNH